MAISNDIEKVLNDFGLKLVIDTKSNLKKKLDERAARHGGKSVKSRLEQSVNSEIVYSNGSINLIVKMNDYWNIVDGGRNASNVSAEGQDKIAAWSATRGVAEKIRIADLYNRRGMQRLSETKRKLKTLKKMPFERAKKAAGFLIARSLKKKNLEPTHFFDEVIKDGRVDKLKEDIAKVVKTEIIVDVQQASK